MVYRSTNLDWAFPNLRFRKISTLHRLPLSGCHTTLQGMILFPIRPNFEDIRHIVIHLLRFTLILNALKMPLCRVLYAYNFCPPQWNVPRWQSNSIHIHHRTKSNTNCIHADSTDFEFIKSAKELGRFILSTLLSSSLYSQRFTMGLALWYRTLLYTPSVQSTMSWQWEKQPEPIHPKPAQQ